MLSIVSLEMMKQQIASIITGPLIPRLSLWVALLAVVVMPIYPFITTWLGSFIENPLVIKAAKDVVIGVMAIGLLVWLLSDGTRRSRMVRDWLLYVILGLIVISLFATILAGDGINQPLLAGILANGRYLAIFFLVYASLRYGDANLRYADMILPWLAWTGVGLSIIGILQVFVLPLDTLESFGYQKDVTIAPYVLIDDNMNAPRAFATLRGPNDFAAYLLITAIAATLLARHNPRWMLGVGLIVFALVLSSSRSAWLGLVTALLVVVLSYYTGASNRAKKRIRYAGVLALVVGAITLYAATTVPALRLAIFHSSPDDTHLTEGSTDQHWIATGNGINRVLDDPLGCGIGCSGPASFYGDSPKIAENYFVQIAEEIGLIGLIVWLGLFVSVMYHLWQRRTDQLALLVFASGVGLSVVGVWLHVWYDDPVSLTWWALAGIILGMSSGKGRKQLE